MEQGWRRDVSRREQSNPPIPNAGVLEETPTTRHRATVPRDTRARAPVQTRRPQPLAAPTRQRTANAPRASGIAPAKAMDQEAITIGECGNVAKGGEIDRPKGMRRAPSCKVRPACEGEARGGAVVDPLSWSAHLTACNCLSIGRALECCPVPMGVTEQRAGRQTGTSFWRHLPRRRLVSAAACVLLVAASAARPLRAPVGGPRRTPPLVD